MSANLRVNALISRYEQFSDVELKREFLRIKKMPNATTNTTAITCMRALLPIMNHRDVALPYTVKNRSDEWMSCLVGTSFFVVLKMMIELV